MTSLSDKRNRALADINLPSALRTAREAYEAGFGKVSKMEPCHNVPFGWSKPDAEALYSKVRSFDHREVYGTGDTWQDALIDWRKDLNRCPQFGKELHWRVPPEVDCYCDFPADKLIWKVYARMSIIPEDKLEDVMADYFCAADGVPNMRLDAPKDGKFVPDIARKLELIANLKWPNEFGEADHWDAARWDPAISAICAEALAEIKRLRAKDDGVVGLCGGIGGVVPVYQTGQQRANAVFQLPPDRAEVEYRNARHVLSDAKAVADLGVFAANELKAKVGRYLQTGEWLSVGYIQAREVQPSEPIPVAVVTDMPVFPAYQPSPDFWRAGPVRLRKLEENPEPSSDPWGSAFAMNTENWA